MWSYLVMLIAAAPATVASSPQCLSGELVGKEVEIDDLGNGRIVLEVRLSNACGGVVRGYRGTLTLTGAESGTTWRRDLSALRPALDPGDARVARFTIALGSSPADLFAWATRREYLRMTWSSTIVAMQDGRTLVAPDVSGEADNVDAGTRALDRLNTATMILNAASTGP